MTETRVRRAGSAAEIEAVHRLNYEAFVVEVGQHAGDGGGRLVDKFHHKNTYYIADRGGLVVGMVAVHDQPPFSVSDRLAEPGAVEGLGGSPLEVRLLTVRPGSRNGLVLPALLVAVQGHARRGGHTHALISGVRPRLPLYERLGFRALGPDVPGGAARFVPMALDLVRPPAGLIRTFERWRARLMDTVGSPPFDA